MQCPKCSGLMLDEEIRDESFKVMPVKRCLICGLVSYPPAPIIPIRVSRRGGRLGIPMHTRPKKIRNEAAYE